MFKKLIISLSLVFSVNFGGAQTKIDSLKTVLKTTTDQRDQLEVLDALTKALVRQNSDEQEVYLQQYAELSRTLGEYDLMASKSRFLLMLYANRSQPQKLIKLSDSLLSYKTRFKKESSEAHILLKRALAYYDLGEFNKAIKDYDASAELFMKSKDSIFAADAYLYGGQVNADSNNFLRALDGFKNASKLYSVLGDDRYALIADMNLSLLYNRNGLIEKGIAEREALLKQALAMKDYTRYIDLSFQNASSYFQRHNYKKQKEYIDQMDYFKDSLKIEREIRYHDFSLTYQKATYHIKTNDLEKANTFLSVLDEKAQQTRSPLYTEEAVHYAKALYFEAIDDLDQLKPVLVKIIEKKKSINQINVLIYAQQKLAELYDAEGDFKKASRLRKSNIKLKDSIFNAQRSNTFLYYQSEFEAEQKQRRLLELDGEIQQLEAEQKLARNKRNTLIAGIISFFIIAIAFFSFRNRQKIKEQAYQNILLNNKVATKTEEINELLAETVLHIKSKERIAKNLQKVIEDDGAITIKSIIADLNASRSDDAKLLIVKENIEKVNFDFVKRLSTQFPDLSKTDIEICSFLKMGLDRNQIAQLRNTTIEAVRKSRHRIRKKMGLDDQIDLENYLTTL